MGTHVLGGACAAVMRGIGPVLEAVQALTRIALEREEVCHATDNDVNVPPRWT
jgi:hypothetical protein